ncbi:DUF4350 domain-containing protein [Kitasatospora paranensis]|uniref:DUF4350 domain-containing protein n=1 Tax=Kitasatospora paranensis TaxID=258053 RepID=A0ABW2G604_9ACTN
MTTAPPLGPADTAPHHDGRPGDGAPAGATSLAVPARLRWRRARWSLATVAVLLLTGLLITGLGGNSSWAPLDPRSPDPSGTRALVHLLERQGVTVRTATGEAELAAALREDDTTVVLPEPYLLDTPDLGGLAATERGRATRLVLLAPDNGVLDAFAGGLRLAADTDGLPDYVTDESTPPGCDLPEATRAGSAEFGGLLYLPQPDDTGCYPRNGHPSLVLHRDATGRQTAVLGTARPLTNARLTTDGNAALALGLLGAHPHLVWYLPGHPAQGQAPPAETRQRSLTDLIPSGWSWAALQLTVAALLAVLWRARRLGPVVGEDLPVVVRAAETTEGRARLYRRANARGHAADALREAARHRLAPVLGVPPAAGGPDPAALCAAAAGRIGRTSADVHALLYGGPPSDDAALLRLTDDLDALERQVRQP